MSVSFSYPQERSLLLNNHLLPTIAAVVNCFLSITAKKKLMAVTEFQMSILGYKSNYIKEY